MSRLLSVFTLFFAGYEVGGLDYTLEMCMPQALQFVLLSWVTTYWWPQLAILACI